MSSEENYTIPEKYADKLSKSIFIAGYLGFGIEYLVKCCELDRNKITMQFLEESGNYYDIWKHGYYLAQTELRNTIMTSALNSSTPSIEKMLHYFNETNDEINNIEDEPNFH
jgi:hypothetical protein